MGTGGTLAGISTYLKEQNQDVKIGLADPMGAAMYGYYKTGELASEGSSITEGIGQGRITSNVAQAKVDLPFQIPDEEALPIVFDLLQDEGLCLGGSSGINVAGAIRLAQRTWPRPHHRHHPVRRRPALSVETVQPGFSQREKSARARLVVDRLIINLSRNRNAGSAVAFFKHLEHAAQGLRLTTRGASGSAR